MSETDQDQKTEEPTGKRLAEAMERGQFARSTELGILFPLAAVLGVLAMTLPAVARDVAEYAISIFTRFASTPVNIDTIPVQISGVMKVSALALVPALVGCVIGVVISGGIQSGFRIASKAIAFKPESLNPVAGFGRIFSKDAAIRAGIDILKLVGIAATLYFGTRNLIYDPLFTAPVESAYLGQFLHNSTLLFLGRLLIALSVVAAISYSYEKFKTHREMMMTKQEVKDEHKQSEGDGRTKSAMRRMARRLMQKQMLSAVPTADVVVTNPTHFAVALKYERGLDKAPVILAKGDNRMARRIKAIAAEHGVPMVENKPVARLLFAMGKVGESIPAELYQAVAGILAVVYRTHRYYFHRLKARRLEAAAS